MGSHVKVGGSWVSKERAREMERNGDDGRSYGDARDTQGGWNTSEVVPRGYRSDGSKNLSHSVWGEGNNTSYSSSSGANNISGTNNDISNNYTHVTMKLPNGMTTTVARSQADKYADMGYEMGSPTMGASSWRIEEGIRNDTAGKDWVDNGYNDGNIGMRNKDGRFSSVNARYADKYFNDGYELDARSQSINRALQGESHKINDRADAAIRSGEYSGSNMDYMQQGIRDEGGYLFSGGDGRGAYNQFGTEGNEGIRDAMSRLLYDFENDESSGEDVLTQMKGLLGLDENSDAGVMDKVKQMSELEKYSGVANAKTRVELPDGTLTQKSDNGKYVLTNTEGETMEFEEGEYTDYMLYVNGFDAIQLTPYVADVEAMNSPEQHKEAPQAEAKAIEAKAKADKGKATNVSSAKVNSFLDNAKSMLGYSYSQANRMGSSSADCSSLVGRAMKMAGITDDAFVTTRSMKTDKRFEKISKAEARPGDIMWQEGHVAIFLGNNKLIEASSSKGKVRESNLGNRFTHAYRIKGIS